MSPALSTSLSIRTATEADMDSLVLLIDMLNISEGNPQQCDRAALKKAFFSKDERVNKFLDVAVIGESIVGFVFYYWGYDLASESYGCHLADLAVHKDARRSGAGSALLAHAGAACMKGGGHWLSLTSATNNHGAKMFYDAAGLQHVDVEFFAIGPRGLRELNERVKAKPSITPTASEQI